MTVGEAPIPPRPQSSPLFSHTGTATFNHSPFFPLQPYTCYAQMPWRSGLSFKRAALRYRHFGAFIAVARDRDTGGVSADPVTPGALQIAYTPSAFDRAHLLDGVLAICRLLHATRTCVEIDPYIDGVAPFVRNNNNFQQQKEEADDDNDFTAWLAEARRVGAVAGNLAAGSAHQMGTCRMSAVEAEGVVDGRGRVWGVEGLHVADSSVFPSASGVNPMVTVMAVADWIARAVDGDLKAA